MSRAGLAPRWAAATVAICGLVACGRVGCGRDAGEVARLTAHSGPVERAAGAGAWASATVGQRFLCGDSARTGAGSTAELSLTAGGVLRMRRGTRLRFDCGDLGLGVRLEAGESELEGAQQIELDIGVVEISENGRARLRAGDGTFRFEVLVGTATVRRPDGEDAVVEAGDSLTLDIDSAVVTRIVPDAAPEPDAAPDAGVDAGPDPGLARVTVEGRLAQVRGPDDKRWSRLPAGEHDLAPGTAVKLGRRTTATVARGEERAVLSAGAEAVAGAADEPLLAMRRGRAVLQATAQPVAASVPGGSVSARPGPGEGSRASVEVGRRSTSVRGQRGVADVIGAGDAREAIQIGERAELSRGGTLKVYGRAPSRTDLVIRAGESATIHDPRPPTAVEIRFADTCAESGVVEVSSGRRREVIISRGEGKARVLLDRRGYRYAVRCLSGGTLESKPSATGSLRVVRDAGTRPLASGVPNTPVDADGRRYTVLYQNRLPAITFRWRGAEDGPATLNVKPSRGAVETFKAKGPVHVLRSGELREGEYEFYFQRGAIRSKSSTLIIEFDNAAPTVYVASPRVNEAWGGQVRVEGAVLPGWAVSVEGTELRLDRKRRFSATLSVSRPALAIRLSNPGRGLHYYVRRSRGK